MIKWKSTNDFCTIYSKPVLCNERFGAAYRKICSQNALMFVIIALQYLCCTHLNLSKTELGCIACA